MMPPPAPQPPQLKWHNTLPQDFSGNQPPKTLVTPSRRGEKRQIPSPDTAASDIQLRPWNEGGDLQHNNENSAECTIPSPTKRHRTIGRAAGASIMTTPVKAGLNNNGSGGVQSAGSGMQTPPPSSSSISKRRGRPPKGASATDSIRLAVLSPASSPSKGSRYIKSTTSLESRSAIDSTKSHGSPLNLKPAVLGSKEATNGTDIYDSKSSFIDADNSLEWPSFDEETGFPSSIGSDLFLHSDMGLGDLSDPMTFSFNCSNDFGSDCLPSIDPNLIFSSRPTSDASSMFGGYGDETDVISSSSVANEQPYQHQYDYSRRERALELQRAQRRKERALRRQRGESSYPNRSATSPESSLCRSNSENVLPGVNSSFRAASLDEAVSRQASMHSRCRENTTPPPSVKHLQPKTSVTLLISPSGRAKTETKVLYEDSETELDETTIGSQSVDESMESDSSFDDPMPRGLGPGGKPYSAVRKAKNAGTFAQRGLGPKLGLFSTAPYQSNSNLDWDILEEEPRTPRISSTTRPVARSASRTNGVGQTPRRFPGKFHDECILSSPKLPTPLRCSPGGAQNRPRILNSSGYGSLRMDSRLQSQTILDISDESEAETVVDENVPLPETEPEQDEEGNALQALRNVVAKRRGTNPPMTVIRSPAKSRPSSAIKQTATYRRSDYHSTPAIPAHIRKSLFAIVPPVPAPAPAPALTASFPPCKTIRRRKIIPDGGYSSSHGLHSHPMQKSNSFSTISDPDFHASSSSTEEEPVDGDDEVRGAGAEGSLESDEMIRCVCGMDRDGGTTMIQCDECNCWLHLKCTGLSRKGLPEVYRCVFCKGEAGAVGNWKGKGKGRVVKMTSKKGAVGVRVRGEPVKRRMA
ncbi:hypothetical protein BDZ91DRAFT_319413 [Kalaharituber pfeilii]|nr:hypothetical protein BDZ91DRAFT_319413 [Kalaharituber pfeilii]